MATVNIQEAKTHLSGLAMILLDTHVALWLLFAPERGRLATADQRLLALGPAVTLEAGR